MVNIVECTAGNRTMGLCNEVVGSANIGGVLGEGVNGVVFSDYGYVVATWSVYTFLVVFAVACLAHVAIAVKTRHWWALWTLALGCAIEAIGWGGRVLSVQTLEWDQNLGGYYQYDFNGFIMQICCTVIAPTFWSAANYLILGKLINATGGKYSFITPRSFSIIFIFSDFCCLVVQGAGGGIAGTANTVDGANTGAYIMTAGVILQLVITVLFVVLLADFIRRYRSDRPAASQIHPLPNKGFFARDYARRGSAQTAASDPYPMQAIESGNNTPRKVENGFQASQSVNEQVISSRQTWIVVAALLFTTLLIVIRSVYRSVELTDGWKGPIAVDQGLFLGLDAFLMAFVAWFYVFVNPAFFLPHQKL